MAATDSSGGDVTGPNSSADACSFVLREIRKAPVAVVRSATKDTDEYQMKAKDVERPHDMIYEQLKDLLELSHKDF